MPSIAVGPPAEGLGRSSACIILHDAAPNVIDWVAENETPGLMAKHRVGQNEFWVDLTIEAWEDAVVHFHIVRSSDELAFEESDVATFEDIVNKINEFSDEIGEEATNIRCRGRFAVHANCLPDDGFVGSLLKAKGMSDGTPLSLTGGILEPDDEVFTSVAFETIDKAGGGIEFTINAEISIKLDAYFLDKIDKLLKIGADRFVLGKLTENDYGTKKNIIREAP
ncbi:MAG TPA: hypothetical protein VND64_10625 [Pirellulales bacterium]|nr:hypothetical protein [Pirellulales bacterium]